MANKNETKHTVNIELPAELQEGTYVNLAMVAHSNSEFILDFIIMMPGLQKAKVKSRLILTPEHAKRFLSVLKNNIDKYENTFGEIKKTEKHPKIPLNFGGTVGEA